MDVRKILARTDKNLAPRPLPLYYSGRRIRSSTPEQMVKELYHRGPVKAFLFTGRTS